jgi:pimeloyl-ACP methyl ester carboxylesterase
VIPADADEQRRQAFLGGGHEAEANESGDDLSPRFSTVVFADEAFPGFGYANPDLIRQIAGPVRTSVQYFDRAGSPVVSAQKPGWYAAVATVSSDALKASFKVRTLLHRAAPPSRPAGNENDPAPGGREEHELWHRVNQAIGDITRYDYVVGLPRDYATSTELLPAVFYLHGSGGGSDESWPVTQKEGIQAGLASGRHGSFIAVSLRSPGGWFPPAVRDVVAEVVRKYRVDPRRVLLTGFSMGGAGTWAVALDYPGLFAAIAPVGGGPGEPGRAAALAGVSVWVFNGQDDSVMTSRAAATMVGALRTAGVDGRLTELPHANHVESLQEVYALDAFYTWLLAQRRDGGTETAALHPSP